MTKYVVKVRDGVGRLRPSTLREIGTVESATLRGARTKAMQLFHKVCWRGGLCASEDLELYDESGERRVSLKDGYEQRWY